MTWFWRVDVPRFRDDDEFGATIDAAAEQLGISSTAVEKDYWVTQVLRVLAGEFTQDFVFKGGTSLSKAYRIVERFSEDVDILVLPGERGGKATDTMMKNMATSAAAGVGGTSEAVGSSERGRHRSYEIHYPATRRASGFIRASVLLETGVRGGPQPREVRPIGSLLGDVLAGTGTELSEFDDLAPFQVSVLHPGRTLLEKLALIHGLVQRLAADPSTPIPPRVSRHFYDVYKLLGDDQVCELLEDRSQVLEVIASVEEISRKQFGGGVGELRPEAGFAACPAFDPGSEVSALLRTGYEATMPELYFGTSPLPTWEAICVRVADTGGLL